MRTPEQVEEYLAIVKEYTATDYDLGLVEALEWVLDDSDHEA